MDVPSREPTTERSPDPGGAVGAINRYRDLAKWLITVFAGIGGLLVAGSQLSSLGKLDLEHHLVRLAAAVLGLALALGMAVWLVNRSLSILRPVEMSLDELARDSALAGRLDAMPSALPFGADSVLEVRVRLEDALDNPFMSTAQKQEWRDHVRPLVDYAAYLRIQERFDAVWSHMAIAAALAACGIVIFSYAANPPAETTQVSGARPAAPSPGSFDLTADGEEALRYSLGARCLTGHHRAIALGGTSSAPDLVTVGSGDCKVARFVLSAEWGAWMPDGSAPGHGP